MDAETAEEARASRLRDIIARYEQQSLAQRMENARLAETISLLKMQHQEAADELQDRVDELEEENADLHYKVHKYKSLRADIQQLEREYRRSTREEHRLQALCRTERTGRLAAQDELEETKRALFALRCRCSELEEAQMAMFRQ